ILLQNPRKNLYHYTISTLVKAKMNAVTGGLDKKQGSVSLWYFSIAFFFSFFLFFFIFFPVHILNNFS
ncbi:hypothetical protein, partial [Thermotalea metallivorans]|uniref:hypothetical protein n=1 Tax=Thermotalea metallivorans TaxID=520762 RepID=UPI001A9A690A